MKEFSREQIMALSSFVAPDRFSTGQSNRDLHLHGEHGVGIGKRKFMALEHGESYGLMRRIKDVMDPKGLMNPGKIFL